jgi:hypothetical protein
MPRTVQIIRLSVAIGFSLCFVGSSRADLIRIHFGPADASGMVAPPPATAEYVSRFGTLTTPIQPKIRPTHISKFIHPYTGRQVQVPITFPPDSTPLILYRNNRIIFNYGTYTIEVVFLPDGSVDVVYNSGFLRPIS